MARSYKKTPGWCDRNPFMKRYANKRIRQLHRRGGEIPDGGRYKRLTCSYDICDWRFLFIRRLSVRRMHTDYERPWQAWRK